MRTPILVLCEDLWHPAEIVRRGLAPLAGGGFEFVFLEGGAAWSVSLMKEFALVILAKANAISAADKTAWLTADSSTELRDCVRGGTSLLILHSGTAGYQELPVMRGLTGGCFLQHPEQCQVDIVPRSSHPITTGVSPFTVKDEHYFMALDDQEAEVFLENRSTHGTQPAGWTRVEGRGRVCVLTPGHNLEVWFHSMFQTLLRNALHWIAGHEGAMR